MQFSRVHFLDQASATISKLPYTKVNQSSLYANRTIAKLLAGPLVEQYSRWQGLVSLRSVRAILRSGLWKWRMSSLCYITLSDSQCRLVHVWYGGGMRRAEELGLVYSLSSCSTSPKTIVGHLMMAMLSDRKTALVHAG